jgi:hypothetical protein
MKAWFMSRKNRLMLAGIAGLVAGALTGEISWQGALYSSVGLISANILGIAHEDNGAKSAGK